MKKLVYYLKRVKMKLTKFTRLLLLFFLAVAVTTACKKDEPEEIQPDSSPIQQLSMDDHSVEGNFDEAFTDVSMVLVGNKYKLDIP
ncbi:MAG: hypothetical protein IMY74_02770, partial [Bacteroidetes bacterium]|nr:hypothetical protein [Bacteroidota bacterium]